MRVLIVGSLHVNEKEVIYQCEILSAINCRWYFRKHSFSNDFSSMTTVAPHQSVVCCNEMRTGLEARGSGCDPQLAVCPGRSCFPSPGFKKLDISKFPSSSEPHRIRSTRSVPSASTEKWVSLSWDNLCCSKINLQKYILGKGLASKLREGFPLPWLWGFCPALFEELVEDPWKQAS